MLNHYLHLMNLKVEIKLNINGNVQNVDMNFIKDMMMGDQFVYVQNVKNLHIH